jgi:hypothetical protein
MFATLATAVIFPTLCGGDAERNHLSAVLHGADFGIATQVADQLHAVNSYRELQSETAAGLDIRRPPEHTRRCAQ